MPRLSTRSGAATAASTASNVATTPAAPNADGSSISTNQPHSVFPASPSALSTPSSSGSSSPPLPTTFTDGLPLPPVLVFDLDYTLWPFWIDTHCTPPLKAQPGGRAARDRHGEPFAFYPDVPGVLAAARAKGLQVAAASRTSAPDLANELLRMLLITPAGEAGSHSGGAHASGALRSGKDDAAKARPAREFFDNLQIYPGNKVTHVERIAKALGRSYEEMLFFDDEERNRNVEREMGVCFQIVHRGVSREEIDKGVRRWRAAKGKGEKA